MCDPALGKPPGCYWLYCEVFGVIKKKNSLYNQYPGARISCRMNKVLSNLIYNLISYIKEVDHLIIFFFFSLNG